MVIMIILLILCLPLVLMLSLYTTTSVVSIAVDVPVTGIDVTVEQMIELDLDKGESFEIPYTISPIEAKRKDVRVTFSQIGEEKLAEFSVDGDRITPTSYGSARVTVETEDGGYRDSFDVIVYSKQVESISSSLENTTLTVGESAVIKTDYNPTVVRDAGLTYKVKEGEGVVSVSSSGVVKALNVGRALIVVISSDNPDARSELYVDVVSSGVFDYPDSEGYITALTNEGKIPVVVNPELSGLTYSVDAFLSDGEPLGDSVVELTYDSSQGALLYRFIDEAFVGDIDIRFTLTNGGEAPVTKSYILHRISEISIDWSDRSGSGEYTVFNSDSAGSRIGIDLRPLGADVSYEITLTYSAVTDVIGTVTSGVAFELVEGVRYVSEGGYLSVELESSSSGVYLVLRGEYEPGLDEIGLTATTIKLTVRDNYTGKTTVLDDITVVVY